ncbi:haloacid dehalogenase-like hydrolase [Nocardia neocaledoniensis]|uniref:haloacid dehalogenase-like hydrolase n=1 Tax=Nocardia neocaledoniensis TaxID=236511 RepID=UPI0033FE5485
MKKISALAAVAMTAALMTSTACGTGEPDAASESCSTLDASQVWYGDNRDRLARFIEETGRCGAAGSGAAPLALFDWDNTIVKNDIGVATFYWMLANDKVLQPEGRDWTTVGAHLTREAADALAAACGAAEPGTPLPTSTDADCADELVAVADSGKTTAGKAAFTDYDHRRTEPGYAFVVQLMRGHTEARITEFARAARAQNLAAAEGTKQTIGTTKVDGWVRYYPQMTDLVRVLRDNGFDVRIISASAEPVVRVWAEELDITGDRVMGVPQLSDNGVYTGHLPGCGDAGTDQVITYIDGKRCRINEQVFGVRGAAAFQQLPADRRAAFAAGDSDTDVVFLGDATGLRLVINRNKTELMCNAYGSGDGTWVVNPMFLDPKPRRSDPYPCATAGFITPAGTGAPLRRPDGSVVPDQQDLVFG